MRLRNGSSRGCCRERTTGRSGVTATTGTPLASTAGSRTAPSGKRAHRQRIGGLGIGCSRGFSAVRLKRHRAALVSNVRMPIAGSTESSPSRSSLALRCRRAAMPTSAQGPHWGQRRPTPGRGGPNSKSHGPPQGALCKPTPSRHGKAGSRKNEGSPKKATLCCETWVIFSGLFADWRDRGMKIIGGALATLQNT